MDNILPEQRRAMMMEWLQEERSLSIEQLAQRFGVSMMTIHRDLDQLAKTGAARKVRGGVMAVEDEPGGGRIIRERCVMCGKRVPPRTAWVITRDEGERCHACCAHCGLLHLNHAPGKQPVLAADFLYGQMVNALQAAFVMGSDVTLCCVPGVLCFASRADAEQFQRGFGGELLDFAGAMAAVVAAHHGP